MVGTFIACLLSVIACFCKQTKTGEAKATGKQFAAAGAVVVVAAVCVGGFSLQSSSLPSADDAEVAPDAAQTSADGPVMYYNDNEYVSKTLDDLIAIPQETWEAKEPNGEVAYFFEGQYTEGFSTIVDPACLDMYCYTDGSMWGSFSGPNTSVGGDSISHVYGYWYNYDENGEKNFVIHLLGNQDADGTVRPTDVEGGADADVFVFDTDHGAYSMEASLSYGVMGGAFTRNINIYGQPYAPAKSLTIDASNLRTFYTGDTFNPGELVVTATRANGAEESIWGGRLTFTGYDSDTTGTKTVTASFLGATATFEVQVEDLVTEQYTGSYELVQGETPTATDAVLLVDYSHKVCTLTAADGSASITGTLVGGASSLNSGAQTLADSVPTLTNAVSQLQSGASQLADGTAQLAANNDTLNSGAAQLADGAGQIQDGASQLADGSVELGDGLVQLSNGAVTLQTSIADGADEVNSIDSTDKTYDMFSAPVMTNETYETTVPTNGNAMAAYMMSVGLWVSGLAFCVMLSPYHQKIGARKPGKAWLLTLGKLWALGLLQAVLMILCLSWINDFQPEYMGKTLIIACLASVAFLTLEYCVNFFLDIIGDFTPLVFMVLQLSGCAGTYPLELSDKFYQVLNPFMPFTYTVHGFRSGIASGLDITTDCVVLAVIAVVFAGLLLVGFRKRAKKEQESEVEVSEKAVSGTPVQA